MKYSSGHTFLQEKSGNVWSETGPKSKRHKFEKQPKLMVPIDITYTEDDPSAKKLSTGLSSSGSKLDPRVQDVVSDSPLIMVAIKWIHH